MDRHLNSLKLNRQDAEDRELAGKFILNFLDNDTFSKELTRQWMQDWAKAGLLHHFCKFYLKSEPKTTNFVPWFIDRVFTDILTHKDSTLLQWQEFMDLLSRNDLQCLENSYQTQRKYNLESESLNRDFQKIVNSIPDKDDQVLFLFSLFSDVIFHSEINILSQIYKEWFGEPYIFNLSSQNS